MNDNITFEIKQRLAVLSENPKTKWTKEVNIVSWNNGPAKLDIREWNPEHDRMSRGLALKEDEARALRVALDRLFGGE